jgi:hypothetical protein
MNYNLIRSGLFIAALNTSLILALNNIIWTMSLLLVCLLL